MPEKHLPTGEVLAVDLLPMEAVVDDIIDIANPAMDGLIDPVLPTHEMLDVAVVHVLGAGESRFID